MKPRILPGDYGKNYKYLNGNYVVFQENGNLYKVALRAGEDLVANFPDSIDLKISNRCSNGCPFCHENSTPNGGLLNIEETKQVLSQLPERPIEIAIGGGNILEDYKGLNGFIEWLKSREHRLRCTLKLEDHMKCIEDEEIAKFLENFGGIGLSVTSLNDKTRELLRNKFDYIGQYAHKIRRPWSIVFHVIAGITPVEDIKFLIEEVPYPVLILGYKQWGRAKNNKLPDFTKIERVIKNTIYQARFTRDYKKLSGRDWNMNLSGEVIAFDNLALEQLHIKDSLLENEWESIYLGEEGKHSMYIDAVKGEFARNSTSPDRVSWNDVPLLEYFKNL